MKLGFTVEYDGTTYSGFQSQKNVLTVQGCIENALKKVTKEDIRINYSGRTDAGVHAMSQVCDFETNIDRNKKNWLNGLNSNLPSSIAVKDIFRVPADFNSRFSAIERKYAYLIYNSDNKPLFFEKHAYWITNKLNTVLMEEELKKFIEFLNKFIPARNVCRPSSTIKSKFFLLIFFHIFLMDLVSN